MEMSEPFATTVAAVGPVIWLVGAVEVQQIMKRMTSWWHEGERGLADARTALTEAVNEEGLLRAQSVLDDTVNPRRVYSLFWLWMVWGALTLALLGATAAALNWLAEGASGTAPGKAAFCYWAIVGGLSCVTMLPMLLMVTDVMQSYKRRSALWGELSELESAAKQRVDQQRSGDEAANPGSSPSP
ncbi:hypothetical protein ACWGH5_17405 [Streptomyces sp. NPDC054864]